MKIIRTDEQQNNIAADGRNLKDHYVGFNARLLMTTLDVILLTPLILLLFGLRDQPEALQVLNQKLSAGLATPADLQTYYIEQGGLTYMLTNSLVDSAVVGIIWIACWKYIGGTPGKYLFGAHIVNATTLKAPSLKQQIIRFFSYFISAAFAFFGFIWVAFDKQKQGWHDKLSNTIVLYKKPHDDAWKARAFKRQTIGVLMMLTVLALYLLIQNQNIQ